MTYLVRGHIESVKLVLCLCFQASKEVVKEEDKKKRPGSRTSVRSSKDSREEPPEPPVPEEPEEPERVWPVSSSLYNFMAFIKAY